MLSPDSHTQVNYGCTKDAQNIGEWDWKMVIIFQLLVPILILIQVPFIPDSPRWFVKRNKIDNARRALSRVRDTQQEVEDELLMIREALEFEREAISSTYSALWKDRSIRKRLLLAFVINAGQQITGQGSLNTYSTIVYKKVFKKQASKIALINALNATFGILFTANATWTVDRFGRKWLRKHKHTSLPRIRTDHPCSHSRRNWHGCLYDHRGRGADRDPRPRRWIEEPVSWHLYRFPALPVRLLLQAGKQVLRV